MNAQLPLNPFFYGKAVPAQRFFGRRDALRTIFSRLQNGESTAVVGEPHIGKSSLMNYIADEAVRAAWLSSADLDFSCAFVEFDCHPLTGEDTPAGWWAERLAQARLGIADASLEPHFAAAERQGFSAAALEALFRQLARKHWRVVLLLDEFDALLGNPNFNRPEFLGALRSIATRTDGLALVVASRLSVARMNRASRNAGSPFFNNMTEVRLLPLSEEESRNVIEATLRRAGGAVQFGPADFELIFDLSGRHPFLMQMAAASLYDALTGDPSNVSTQALAIEGFNARAAPHFDDFWRSIERSEQRALLVLAMASAAGHAQQREFDVAELGRLEWYGPDLRQLHQMGIVRRLDAPDGARYANWEGERWRVNAGGLSAWIIENVIGGSREARDFAAWLGEQQQDGLLSPDEVDRLAALAERLIASAGSAPDGPPAPAELRDKLIRHFSMDEIELLCADLDVPFEDIRRDAVSATCLHLITYMTQRNRLDDLIARCRALRPATGF